MGCEEYCPLCRRQCDKVHDDNENVAEREHSCTNGHQIQGFGGNKQHLDNHAITLTCSDFQNTDQVFHNNKQIDWASFKTQIISDKKWKFEADNPVELSQVRQKNIKVWNYFGEKVCRLYREGMPIDKTVEIQFRPAAFENYGINHYILMLDDSSSMEDQNWNDLMAAVKSLIQSFERASTQVKRHSALSCIIYNTTARVAFKNVGNTNIKESLLSKIRYEGGRTDFGHPLTEALKIMNECRDQTSQFILCLMTDGDANYPKQEIDIIQASTIVKLIQFKSIYFGSPEDKPAVLQQIADKFNGTVETAINLEQLKNAFINLNPNFYRA